MMAFSFAAKSSWLRNGSAVFSWALWKTRTLTVPILLHTAWDLLVTLLA